MGRRQRNNRLSADQRAEYVRQRRELIGTLVTQKGFEGALVIEHIRGSQYLVRLPDGREIYMSHKKPRYQPEADTFLTEGGWSPWVERN